MSPEPTYTVEEFAAKTGRSYGFWDAEIRAGRLPCAQPGGRKGTRYIPESAYGTWWDVTAVQQTDAPELTVEAPDFVGDDFDWASIKR